MGELRAPTLTKYRTRNLGRFPKGRASGRNVSRTFPSSNADYLATVGGVRATASWLFNATSIAVPAGLTFIVAGAPIYDTSLGVGAAGLIGTVTGYSGTTLSTSALSSASVGLTDSLLIGAGLLPLLAAGFPLTVSAWFKCPSNPTNNEVIFDMGGGGASANAMRLYLGWNSPQLLLGVEPANNNNATYSNKASASWVLTAPTITVSSPAGSNNTNILPGQTIYDITASAIVGTVSSFNSGTGVITLTSGGATHASSGASDLLIIGTPISLNQWHHAGGVVTGTNQSAYLDGVLTGQSTSTNTFPTVVNVATIGAQQNNSISFPFTGSIGEVCVWNIALTAAEMLSLASGTPACFIAPASIIGYWPLYGYNSPELDFSSIGNELKIIGALAQDVPPPLVTPPKIILYPTTGNITLPTDFNTSFNVVDCIGESGNAAGGTTLATGGGAGAGANATIVNYAANGAGAVVPVTVGVGGSGVKTIFDTANNSCVADFGTSASGATAGSGGLVANSVGVTAYAGGNGSAGATAAGGSGGGSAGPGGAGGNASASATTTSGNGGTANGGAQAGGVGVGTTNPGNSGIAQSPAVWTQTVGGATASPSSGASGAGGASLTAEAGGAAVAYGGAPGGGDLVSIGTSNPGVPSAGIIILSYLSNSPAVVRRTLTPTGTRVGSRQSMGA